MRASVVIALAFSLVAVTVPAQAQEAVWTQTIASVAKVGMGASDVHALTP